MIPYRIPPRPSSVRVAYRYLCSREVRADSFEEAIEGKKFKNPETGREVQFSSLPSEEQKRVRDSWSKKNKEEGGHDHGEKKSLADRIKGLGQKAREFVQKAPDTVKKFISDPEYRKESMKATATAVAETPSKYAKSVLKTVKHEVKEFKEAGEGIKAVLKGGKMSGEQKKAFKTVASHMAIGIAAAALTASGPVSAAGIFAKGLAKNVALKAAVEGMESLHTLEEFAHIGHGIKHLLHLAGEDEDDDDEDDGDEDEVDEVLQNYISAMVAKQLQNLGDDEILESLSSMEEG